jgi:hypothetical protein
MNKANTIGIILIALLVVGAALGLRSHKSPAPDAPSSIPSSLSIPVTSTDLAQASNGKSPVEETPAPKVTEPPKTDDVPLTPVNVLKLDSSVIGTPFPVSASVEKGCRDNQCDEVRKQLARMAQEPRDVAWASEMEMAIQQNVESRGPDKFLIRSLECRSSICAVETVSPDGQYLGPAYPSPLLNKLSGSVMIPMWGYELDASGARISVSVLVLLRR